MTITITAHGGPKGTEVHHTDAKGVRRPVAVERVYHAAGTTVIEAKDLDGELLTLLEDDPEVIIHHTYTPAPEPMYIVNPAFDPAYRIDWGQVFAPALAEVRRGPRFRLSDLSGS